MSTARTWLGVDAKEIGLIDEIDYSDNILRTYIDNGAQVIKIIPKVKSTGKWWDVLGQYSKPIPMRGGQLGHGQDLLQSGVNFLTGIAEFYASKSSTFLTNNPTIEYNE